MKLQKVHQYLLILLQSVPVLIELAPFPAHAQQIT